MGTFNPRQTRIRIAPQATQGLPNRIAAASWKDIRLRPGASPTPTWNRVEDDTIDGGSFEAQRLAGIIEHQGIEIPAAANAEELIYLLGFGAGGSTNTVLVGGNVFQEQFVPEAGSTDWPDFFQVQIDRQDDYPMFFYDGRVVSLGLSAEGNSVVGATYGLAFGGHHQWQDATLVNNQTLTAQIRGLPDSAMWNQATAAEQRIYVKVTDASGWTGYAGGSIVVKVAVGATAAASYAGSTTVTLTANTWGQALDCDVAITDTLHNRIGDPGQKVELRIPLGVTPVNDDEFYFELGQDSWTPSYSAAPSLSSVHASLLYDTEDIQLDTFDVTWNVPFFAQHGPGQKFEKVNLRQGAHGGELTIGRRYVDLVLAKQRRFSGGTLPKFEAQIRSEATFSDDYAYAVIAVAPAVDFTGTDPDTDAESFGEEMTGTLHEDTAEGWATGPINFRTVTSISAPAT